MKIKHHDLEVELEDSWWYGAEMQTFVPTTKSYLPDHRFALGRAVQEVSIQDLAPVRRAPGIRIFNDNEDGLSARDRVLRLFSGFKTAAAIPPVQVVNEEGSGPHRYRLVDGTHRLYCSIAAGFTCVPAIEVLDWSGF